MTEKSQEVGYSADDLKKSGKATDDSMSLLSTPRNAFAEAARPTSTCFGLLPEGSKELADDYLKFYTNTIDWVDALMWNLNNAGLTLDQTKKNYDRTNPVR
ncbi:hypothetical protein AB0H88_06190 [Nonomuraea sp. NPDC050680]|jgi:hypothetical protein|uniref:hypothetical protein n=1 Tax=Nonomuraea sp. NPDC050680 TaxID=3154630 RepID=UPI0033D05CA5